MVSGDKGESPELLGALALSTSPVSSPSWVAL